MIKKLIALTSILCCTLALPISSNAMELEKDNQKSELRLLDYTIDEIRQMKLGQYYQELFPEIWENQRASSLGVYKGTTSIRQVASKQIEMKSKTYRYLTGPTAKKIRHSYVYYDRAGNTYGGGLSGDVDTKSYTSSMRSGTTIPVGKIMRAETVHTVTFPSNYKPTVQTFTSYSGEIKISY